MIRNLSIAMIAAAAALALSACDRPADKTGANESPPRTAQAPDSPRAPATRDPAMTPPPPSSPSAMPEKEKRDSSSNLPGSAK